MFDADSFLIPNSQILILLCHLGVHLEELFESLSVVFESATYVDSSECLSASSASPRF